MNSALALAHGNPASWFSMLGQLHPARGVYTAVAKGGESGLPLIGQVNYMPGERSARFSFLIAQPELNESAAVALLENLIMQTGNWGAANILAEVDESALIFPCLRRSGFAVYSRQEVWRVPAPERTNDTHGQEWHEATPLDAEPVQRLCHALLPPLVQSAEEQSTFCPRGLVVRRDNQVVAFVQVLTGARGICVQPLFHPQVADARALLDGLLNRVQGMFLAPLERPIYCMVRSYQAGLAGILAEMGADLIGEQALLVKHLAVRQRQEVPEMHFSTIDRHVRPSSPLVRHVSLPEKTE